jgi:hypothetical protein
MARADSRAVIAVKVFIQLFGLMFQGALPLGVIDVVAPSTSWRGASCSRAAKKQRLPVDFCHGQPEMDYLRVIPR